MTRDQLRLRIDTMELVHDTMTCIDDISEMESDPATRALVDITVTDRSTQKSPVAFLHALPPAILQVGLKAIQAALEEQLQMEKV